MIGARVYCTAKNVSSWPYGIVYFWLLGLVLCEAQRREHSRSYVTGVVTKHDCMDAGARATQEQLPGVIAHLVRKYDFIWLTTYVLTKITLQ